MRRKAYLAIVAFIAAIASLIMVAGPADASQTGYCSVGGFAYTGTVNFNRPGNGNVVFHDWAISGSGPIEYRVRWYTQGNLANPMYDSGYSTVPGSSVAAFPGTTRYLPGVQTFALVNAGKAFDGLATCAISPAPFIIPGG